MQAITAFFRRLQIGKMAVALLLGAVLFTMTACNNGNELGARPQNPPVQMGGQNNPHKMGGDGYTEYKSSLDSNAQSRDQSMVSSDQPLASATGIIIAAIDIADNGGVLLYPSQDKVQSADSKDDFVSAQRQKQLLDPSQIPAVKQPVIDRSDPNAKILEKAGQAFKDASGFLNDSGQEGDDRASLR